MPLPWSSHLAAELQRDRLELLVAFVELRNRLQDAGIQDSPGGEQERKESLAATERDYAALVSAGAEAARLQRELEAADRQAMPREVDSAAVVIRQMLELVEAVASRIPPSRDLGAGG